MLNTLLDSRKGKEKGQKKLKSSEVHVKVLLRSKEKLAVLYKEEKRGEITTLKN